MGAEGIEPVVMDGTTPSAEPTAQEQGQVQEPKTVPVEVVTKLAGKLDQIEAQLQQKDQAIYYLQQQIAAAARPQPQQAQSALPGDDEVGTVGEMRQILRQELQGYKQEFNQRVSEQEARVLAQQQQSARMRHEDYDEVWKLAEKRVAENPALVEILKAQPDRFEAAYLAGQLHPEYLEKLKTKETATAAQRVAGNLNRQKTTAEIGGAGPITQTPDYINMARTDVGKRELDDLYNNLVYGLPLPSPKK